MTLAHLDGWMAERMGLAQPLTRAALEAWQLARLRETIAHARAASPFYRSRRDWPDVGIGGFEDLARLPFTEQADLVRNDPPLLALSQSAIARAVTLDTSGTSGPPKRLYFTAEELEATIDFFHHGMAVFTRPGDVAAISFPSGRAGGIGEGLATALRRLGATPLVAPLSSGPDGLVAWLRAEKPDVIAGPPVPLLAAARLAVSDGGTPLRVRAVLLSSGYVAVSLARAITAACGAEIFEHWGMTETGYGGAVDCAYHVGCHLRENELFAEVADPETGGQLPPGAQGELVISTLRRRGMPLLRYRTGDLVRLIEEPCPCGSVLRRLGAVSGRAGTGVALPGGGTLTLPLLDEALFAIEGVTDFIATVQKGAPATLRLSIATPVNMRTPAVLDAADARLAAAPVTGEAIRTGALRVEAAFADATVFRHGGKRRLLIQEDAPCAPCC
ncbi:MAG: DVU_1553 family AMP-dependent CoA ligase [Rhodomicrobium sp.]